MDRGNISQHFFSMSALNRPFQLGGFYDYRTDTIISDRLQSLESWAEGEFKVQVSSVNKTSKWEKMDICKHLQMSIMSGIIDDFQGSSNFVNHQPDTAEAEVSQALVCRIQTKKRCLITEDIQPLLSNWLQSVTVSEATHIVVDVIYGAEAYCILTRDEQIETNDKQQFVLATKLGNAIEDELDLAQFKEQFNQEEKQQLSRALNCCVYADFSHKPERRCNIFSAYQKCQALVMQLRKNDFYAVPISVVLCPLTAIMGRAGIFRKLSEYRDISVDLVDRCRFLWYKLDHFIAKANHLSQDQFREAIIKFRNHLRDNLRAAVVDSRRSKNGNEKEIDRIISTAESHPLFKTIRLSRWLEYKKAEMEMMEKMSRVNGVTFLASKIQLEEKLSESLDNKFALVLYVPPMDQVTNAILEQMENYVENMGSTGNRIEEGIDHVQETTVPWFMIQQKRKEVLDKIRDLSSHVQRNMDMEGQFFIVVGETGRECHYSVYEADSLIRDNLNRLPSPPTELRTRLPKTHEAKRAKLSSTSICLEWTSEVLYIPCFYLIEFRSKGNGDGPWKQQKTTKSCLTETIIHYETGSSIEIRVAEETCIGRSEFSDIFDTDDYQTGTQSSEPTDQQKKASPTAGSSRPKKTAPPSTTPAIRFAKSINKSSLQQTLKTGCCPLYNVPFTDLTHPSSEFIRLSYGNSGRIGQHKTILLMGYSKTDKFIDVMLNYIFNVAWKDKERFRIIPLSYLNRPYCETRADGSKYWHKEVDDRITIYDIHHSEGFQIPFSLTIIATRKMNFNKEKGNVALVKLLHKCFQETGVNQRLNAICFLGEKTGCSLTPSELSCMDLVESTFDKDTQKVIKCVFSFDQFNALPQSNDHAKDRTEREASLLHFNFDEKVFFCLNEELKMPVTCIQFLGAHQRIVPMSEYDPAHYALLVEKVRQSKLNPELWKMCQNNFHAFFSALSAI